MKKHIISVLLLLVIFEACQASSSNITIAYLNGTYKELLSDSLPLPRRDRKKNFLGIAPLGVIITRPRMQYEWHAGKFGIGGILTRYSATWRGHKLEPFTRVYLNPKSRLKIFLHLQAGLGLFRMPYTKVTTTESVVSAQFPNYEIRKHVFMYGAGVGLGAKLINRKNFFFDLCLRSQHYELSAGNARRVEKDNVLHTYYPSRGNGFFRVTGPGAEWVSSFIVGWRL